MRPRATRSPRKSCGAPSISSRRRCSVLDLRPGDPLCLLGGLAELYAPRSVGRLPRAAASAAAGCAGRRRADGGAPVRSGQGSRPMAEAAEDIFAALKASGQQRRAALSAAEEIDRGRRPPRRHRARRCAAVGARHRGQGRRVARHRAQGRAGSGARRHPGAAARLRHLRGATRRARRAIAVAAHLLHRGHGAARHGGALRMARSRHLPALARGDDGARPVVEGNGGARQPAAHRQRHAAGDRARFAVVEPCCPNRRRSAPRSMPRWRRPAIARCAPCSGSPRPISARPTPGCLAIPAGSAGLNIERISYLATGKVIEFTRSIYRGDTYDFVAELRLTGPAEQRSRADD